MAENTKSQADQRVSINGTDVFGRRYLYSLETQGKRAGVCGQIHAIDQHAVPTPDQYLSVDPRRPYQVRVNFAQWVLDLEEAWRTRKDREDSVREQFPQANDARVRHLLGPEPLKPEVIRKQAEQVRVTPLKRVWKLLTKTAKAPPAIVTDDESGLEGLLPAVKAPEEEDGGVTVGSRGAS